MKHKHNQEHGSAWIVLLALIVTAAVLTAGYFVLASDNNEPIEQAQIEDVTSNAPEDTQAIEEPTVEYQQEAILDDVTNAENLLGVQFDGTSRGIARALVNESEYVLVAEFENLPELDDSLFYEGWVVGGAEGIVSTGALVLENGIFTNTYTDERDLSDSKRYVLTLEPNDGDPAPADHVVEGDFIQL